MGYSHTCAWIFTGLDIYGLFWATAILRANRLRASQLDATHFHLRAGLIWEVEIPLDQIAFIRSFATTDKPDLKAVFLNTPKLLIGLTHPTQATGLYGNSRAVTTIAFSVDFPDQLIASLR
jgi:hypothetical protein